jgi:hypothetical protein
VQAYKGPPASELLRLDLEEEPWPRVVAVQSSQNSTENNGSGGQDMVDLVIRARSDHP